WRGREDDADAAGQQRLHAKPESGSLRQHGGDLIFANQGGAGEAGRNTVAEMRLRALDPAAQRSPDLRALDDAECLQHQISLTVEDVDLTVDIPVGNGGLKRVSNIAVDHR